MVGMAVLIFPFSVYCFIPLQTPVSYKIQPKVLAASEGYHVVVITPNMRVNRRVSQIWRGEAQLLEV
jgi:hypothetical protein